MSIAVLRHTHGTYGDVMVDVACAPVSVGARGGVVGAARRVGPAAANGRFLGYLAAPERQELALLREHDWRLEQEQIPWGVARLKLWSKLGGAG